MRLEDQVVSLELAKILKELGVEQESLYCWIPTIPNPKNDYHLTSNTYESKPDYIISAYTVAELGEMLSSGMTGSNKTAKSEKGDWRCKYEIIGLSNTTRETFADTEADARAKMLIYLVENELLEPNPQDGKATEKI